MEQEQDLRQSPKSIENSGAAEYVSLSGKRHGLPNFWLFAVCVFLASFLLTSAVLFFTREEGQELETEQKMAEKIIAEGDKVEERIFYTKCQHLVTETNETQLYTGMNIDDLEKQGWQVTPKGEKDWWLYREENAFCPDDMDKRSIRRNGSKLSVYTGPVGTEGDLLFDLDYEDSILPENWREQLEKGGIDFADEQILFSALESLDEYME